jgi:hypothetical protein
MMLQAFYDLRGQLADVVEREGGTCIIGRRNGTLLCIRINVDALFITAALTHWPADIFIRSPLVAQQRTTGDAEFDAVVEVHRGNDGWRLVLDATQRARLIELCDDRFVHIAMRALNTRIEHRESRSLLRTIDLVCAVAAAPIHWSDGFEETVFAMAKSEPNPAVRLEHFVWLASRQWNTPLVYEIAMADSDALVRRWAADNRPVQHGAFR